MKTRVYLFFLCLLTSCRPGTAAIPQEPVEPVALPSPWTPTATATERPPPTATATITPTPTQTPYPAAYQDNPWVISIQGPPRWYSAKFLVELSDGAILASGHVYNDHGQQTIWLARLSRAGELAWLRTIPLPEYHKYFPASLSAGSDGKGLLSGTYTFPTDGPYNGREHVLFSIALDGELEWKVARYSNYSEQGEDGSMMLFTNLGARKLNADGTLDWQASLDFGDAFMLEPMYYPLPSLVQGHHHPEGVLTFAGTIEDLVVPGDMIARAGPDPGFTTYWFAGFNPEGALRWKHFYTVNPLQQSKMYGAVMDDGSLVVGGTHFSRVVTATDYYFNFHYAWVRRVDPNGRTIFHQRYLDLPRLDGIESTPDGGLILKGIRYVRGDEDNPSHEYAQLVKLDLDGRVEWAREFREGIEIEAVLALRDGTYLLSIGNDMTFARLDSRGLLPGCTDVFSNEIQMRADSMPAEYDVAGQVPLAMSIEYSGPVEPVNPSLGLSSADAIVSEYCRYIP